MVSVAYECGEGRAASSAGTSLPQSGVGWSGTAYSIGIFNGSVVDKDRLRGAHVGGFRDVVRVLTDVRRIELQLAIIVQREHIRGCYRTLPVILTQRPVYVYLH